jgi:membrane-associated protease RseP (regulator of RpoE activity)
MTRRCLALLVAALFLAGPAYGDEPKAKLPTFEVPYRLTNTMHIMVRAKINGKGPFNFIVDTGAPMLVVATPIGKKLGLVADKAGWTVLDRFEIEGGAVRKKMKCRLETPFQLEGMNGLGMAGVELHGMMGYTVLAHYRMEIDFTRDKMKWTELAFQPPPPQGIKGKDSGAMASLEFLGSIMKFLGALAGKQPDVLEPRGFLGIELAEKDSTVTIKGVLAKTPAAAAGLKAGDRIERLQGRPVPTLAELQRLAGRVTAGQEFRLNIRRGDETKEITVTAGEGL